eukprot:TRINITY_DN1835_c0_g1_i1.p2 TRINITY_DN1835_c0_g1~~TRINITY_DN1835_c0_g1_i1.p2  ORF type:complete len:199 (-),score=37.60 TRINITY_DN1835_c0_g1_i1:12-608(-)
MAACASPPLQQRLADSVTAATAAAGMPPCSRSPSPYAATAPPAEVLPTVPQQPPPPYTAAAASASSAERPHLPPPPPYCPQSAKSPAGDMTLAPPHAVHTLAPVGPLAPQINGADLLGDVVPEWVEVRNGDGLPYFWNTHRNTTTWDRPTGAASVQLAAFLPRMHSNCATLQQGLTPGGPAPQQPQPQGASQQPNILL